MSTGPRHRHQKSAAAWVALFVSVALHVPLLLLFNVFKPDPDVLERTNFDATSEFSIDVVAEAEEPEEKEEDVLDENLQIVSLDPPEVEETPEEARFADQYESKAEEETVKKALPGALERPQAPIPQPIEPARPDETEGDAEDEPAPEEAQPSPDLDEDGVDVQAEKQTSAPPPNPSKLFPSLNDANAAEMLGEGGSLDYLRDVDEGDKTLLNRKRTRYWAFFDRVKQQVSKEWSPVGEYRKRDPYGNVYGVKDRYSTVDVTLNGDGTVRRLYLSRASGLEFFDDEAVRALQSAAPFHNPPEGLKDEDGLIHFTFGFYFEISSGQFRFIRVNN